MRDRRSDAHRQLAEATMGPLPSDVDVDHIDGDKSNNAPSNLRPLRHGQHSAVTNASGRRTTQQLRKALTADPAKKLY